MMRGFATFWGKHRIIAEQSGATSYLRSKCIISPQAMHHLTNNRFYAILNSKRRPMRLNPQNIDCFYQHSKGKQMKVFLKFLEVIFTIVYVVWNLIEILAIPALFLIIGLLNSFPWQYYAATIGGYFIIAIVIQIICHFIFKHFEKKYESALMRLFEKIFNKKS